MKVIFFGSSKYVIPIIENLKKNFDLELVVTTEKNETDAVPAYCKKNDLNFLSVSSLSDLIHNSKFIIHNSSIAVIASFGLIVPKQILDLFPKGFINIHPSLLPKYRGSSPVQQAICNGDKTTGVSIMLLDSEMDHGPILKQQEEIIADNDTAETLYQRLFQKGATLLPEILKDYVKEKIISQPQDHSKATYTKILTREDGFIDLNNPPEPQQLNHMIRAYFPWPGAWTLLCPKASEGQAKELRIKLLPENKIQVEGKKPISYKDFINGYPEVKQLFEKLRLV